MQRVFIGIPVDGRSQRLINSLLMPVKDSRTDVRWVPESNRHLTLAFMGDIQETRVDSLVRVFDETYQHEPRFQYRLSALARFPDTRGRIIALTGRVAGPLVDLFQLTRELLDKNEIEFDQKKFRPHITLARIRKPGQVKTSIDQKTDIILDINSVVLYESTTGKAGVVYSRLKETKLGQFKDPDGSKIEQY